VISINLSAKLLLRADLVDRIIEIIDVYGISPSRIMLEITETAAISTGDIALQVLKRIQNAGFKLSIDDYGTGATSMEYLKKVPASELKIDRSFVANIAESRSDFVLVSSTIALAKSLGMDVIAEGIESKEIVELLRSLDCYGGQGYYFAKPMGLDAAVNFITGDKLRISGASAVGTRK
jgi:EAL domain-containing protein (putative c-di-GMP-specific phosphodiesterase class I)